MSLDHRNEPFLTDNGYTQSAAAHGLDRADRLLARCRLSPYWNPSCIAKSRTCFMLSNKMRFCFETSRLGCKDFVKLICS